MSSMSATTNDWARVNLCFVLIEIKILFGSEAILVNCWRLSLVRLHWLFSLVRQLLSFSALNLSRLKRGSSTVRSTACWIMFHAISMSSALAFLALTQNLMIYFSFIMAGVNCILPLSFNRVTKFLLIILGPFEIFKKSWESLYTANWCFYIQYILSNENKLILMLLCQIFQIYYL